MVIFFFNLKTVTIANNFRIFLGLELAKRNKTSFLVIAFIKNIHEGNIYKMICEK